MSELTVYGSEIAAGLCILGLIQSVVFVYGRYRAHRDIKNSVEQKEESASSFSFSLYTLLLCLCAASMIVRMQFIEEKNIFVCEAVCAFEAVVISSSKNKDEYQTFTVMPRSEVATYAIEVKVPLYPQYHVGESVSLTGKVMQPKTFMQHGDDRIFDYEMYLRIHGIGSQMLYPKIEEAKSEGTNFSISLQYMRERFNTILLRYVHQPASTLASGMLFGVSSMSSELLQTFRVAGLSHIIVLSGFNIAILISFVLIVLTFLPLTLRVIFAGIVIVLFVIMVGGEASIMRATLMASIGLLALLIGRAYTARQALLISLIAIIIYEPLHALHDVSLHLSFLATAGILYMSDAVRKKLARIQSDTFREIITTTLCAYVATLPYVMYTFGTISLYALFANVIVLPVVPLVMFLSMLVVISGFVSGALASLFGYLTSFLSDYIIFVGRGIESLPFASIAQEISLLTMFFLYGCITLFFLFITQETKNETSLTNENEIESGILSY